MNCIVFDKTGTLTVGKPVVVNTKLLKNMALQEFYELVAATEVGLSPKTIIYFKEHFCKAWPCNITGLQSSFDR